MQSIPLENGPVRVTGAYDFDRTDTGMMPRRLPAWTRIQMQPFIDFVVAMSSGIRLEFVTDSERIELDAGLVRFDLGGGNVADAVFDLEIDHCEPVSSPGDGGDLVSMDTDNPGNIRVQRGKGCTVVFNARRAAGDSNLHYLDGLELFGEADVAELPDGLHPNAAGYARMGERFSARVFAPGGVFAALT